MKKLIVRFCAMLLVLWYCFSVIGFNVHTCKASGRSFVATFISGLTCADIHPGHTCDKEHCGAAHEKACCHHHDCNGGMPAFRTAACCQNDHIVLSITGCSSEDNNRQHDFCSCAFYACVDLPAFIIRHQTSGIHEFIEHFPGLIVHRDRQSLLNIWRI